MMYHHTKFELPNEFHNNYVNAQSCIISTFISINIVRLFFQANPKMPKLKFRQKMEKMFVYLPYTSHFIK